MRGKLIVIEGLDGSGKATQTELLCSRLAEKGIDAVKLSFPDYNSPSSSLVKMYLGGEFSSVPGGVNAYAASSFYAVDRCASYLKYWKSGYQSGGFYIADRYATSNAIYQMSKLPKSEWDSFLNWIEEYEYGKLELPKPDAVIYLDMDLKISQRLLSSRYNGDETKKDIHESDIAFLMQCRESALYAAKRLGWNVIACDDGENPRGLGDISDDVLKIVEES